jgi:hypothetical protein
MAGALKDLDPDAAETIRSAALVWTAWIQDLLDRRAHGVIAAGRLLNEYDVSTCELILRAVESETARSSSSLETSSRSGFVMFPTSWVIGAGSFRCSRTFIGNAIQIHGRRRADHP